MGEWFFPRSPTGLYTKGRFELCGKQLHGWLSFMCDVKGSAITLKQKQQFILDIIVVSFGGTIYVKDSIVVNRWEEQSKLYR